VALALELTANGSAEVALPGGALLTLLVSLSNPSADPVEVGLSVAPWWTKLEVVDAKERQVFWPFEMLSHYPDENIVRLAEGGSAQVELGLGPDDVAGIPVGSYAIRARLPVPGEAEPAESNAVAVKVLREDLTDDEAKSPEHLTALATYLTKRRRHVEARAVIDELLQVGVASMSGLVLLGELQEQLQDREGAIRTYAHAEQLFWEQNPDSPEGPEILAARIVRLRRGG
jgi:hypothetical protein